MNDYFGLFVNAFVLKSALGADVEQLIADARCDAATLPNFFDGAPLPASTGKAHPAVAALLKTAEVEAAALALDYLRNAERARMAGLERGCGVLRAGGPCAAARPPQSTDLPRSCLKAKPLRGLLGLLPLVAARIKVHQLHNAILR
jgi:hypothetical protein